MANFLFVLSRDDNEVTTRSYYLFAPGKISK